MSRNVADLREALKALADYHDGYADGVGPCVCEAHLLARQSLAAEPTESLDARAIVETLGFDPTNHHNAAKCPYCSQPSQALRSEQEKSDE